MNGWWLDHLNSCKECTDEALCPDAAAAYKAEVDALDREMGYDPSEND